MSEKDRERWDAKWQSRMESSFEPHPLLLQQQALMAGEGLALDLACGRGQNSLWLARQGYDVLGVDISHVALSAAKADSNRNNLSHRIRFERLDIDNYSLPLDVYDLICVIRFLDRRLFPMIETSLRPGGRLVYAARHRAVLEEYPQTNDAYLLEKDELLKRFGDWSILHYHEGPIEAELIARKPESA